MRKEIHEGNPDNLLYEVNKRVNELKQKKYQSMLKSGKIIFKIKEGKVFREVVNEAKAWDADLIIAGTMVPLVLKNSGWEAMPTKL